MNSPASIRLAFATIAWAAACSEPNQAPFSCGSTPPQTVAMHDSISFLPCFTDPDADPLTISAEVAHHQQVFVTTSVSGETVTLHGTREHGLLPVTVTATDPSGLVAAEEVEVTIRGLHDLTVLAAGPDSQTVQNGIFELYARIANIGESVAKISTWTVRLSSDSVITTADSIYDPGFVAYNMPVGGGGLLRIEVGNHYDPGKPYFGWCGESATPEYNLANNCSKGLRVVFPDSTAEGPGHSAPSGSHEVIVRRFPARKSVWLRNDSR